jgi:hypothetical protein
MGKGGAAQLPRAGAKWGRARARRLRFRHRTNGRQHGRQLRGHGIVWEAQHAISRLYEQSCPFGIVLALAGVNIAIKLDDETAIGTAKVRDEWADGVLTPELQPR